jgi:hypothetical protein
VTTEKDSEKLAAFATTTAFSHSKSAQFFVLEVELEITTNLEGIKKRLKQVVTESKSGLKESKD